MVHHITLMEAYLIEIIRSNGISNETFLAKVEEKALEEFQHLHESFDFRELYPLVDRGKDVLEDILYEGYQIRYVTFHGLINLLRLKFGKVQERDFQVEEYVIKDLELSDAEREELAQCLSNNWVLEPTRQGVTIKARYQSS